VQLTLSTATPALVASAPTLQPLTVALGSPQQDQQWLAGLKDKSYADAKQVLAERQRAEEQNRALNMQGQESRAAGRASQMAQTGSARDASEVFSLDAGLNDIAKKSELLDLVSATKLDRKGRGDGLTIRQGDEGVSVSYKVTGRTSMPSRADQQLIQIAQLDLPTQVIKLATPTLTQYIYNEAKLTNTSEMVLLAGPSASYVAGEFVGSGGVPTVSAGESFRAGFGIDTSLRTGKELLERSESVQGGNRIIEFTYRLSVENFGKGPASVRLVDRLPVPRGPEIKLTLLNQSTGLSEDADYLETDRKKNLLRWDLPVPAGATGSKAVTVEYKFRVEFDKQMSLTEGQ
jgi:hypothetical protein